MNKRYTIVIGKENPQWVPNHEVMRMKLLTECRYIMDKYEIKGRIEWNTIRYILSAELDATMNPIFCKNDNIVDFWVYLLPNQEDLETYKVTIDVTYIP